MKNITFDDDPHIPGQTTSPPAYKGPDAFRRWFAKQGLTMRAFCLQHGIDRVQLMRVLSGQRGHHISVKFAYAIERATGGIVTWQMWI